MNYQKLTVSELKNMCKKNHIKGYSNLNKDDLIKIIKKNLKKKMKGGDGNSIKRIEEDIILDSIKRIEEDIILDRRKLLELLGYHSNYYLHSKNNNKLKKLETINLSNKNIIEIKKGTFDGLNNLRKLDLSNNKITTAGINNNVGYELENLETVDLSNNKIKVINGSSNMTGYGNLKILNLSNNQIEDIDGSGFKYYKNSLQNLEELYLTNNPIKTIKKNSFFELQNFKKLCLSNSLNIKIKENISKSFANKNKKIEISYI